MSAEIDPKIAGVDLLEFWRHSASGGALRCPVCRGHLSVQERCFTCLSCGAAYPVESGVPLLIRPDEVVSIPSRVMEAFNLPAPFRSRVDAALVPLTKYRADKHQEFGNVLARFDPLPPSILARRLELVEINAAVAQISCVTTCFPPTLCASGVEHRSLRLRNSSGYVLFTDERMPLYLSYRLYRSNGEVIPFEAPLSRIPSPLAPGAEVSVPVEVRLPPDAAGQLTVRFQFLYDRVIPAVPAIEPEPPPPSWLPWRRRQPAPPPPPPPPPPVKPDPWLGHAPLAEMPVTVVAEPPVFPAERNGLFVNFDLREDVARADRFMAGVVAGLEAEGVTRPRILEVGSGVYPIALRTCGDNATVVVSDISLVMQLFAAILHTNDSAVVTRRAAFASFDMMHPPFADGAFDVICICAALHHIARPEAFLRQLAPLLSPQGRFVAVREPCIVNPAEPTYISELENGFNEQMFELSEWHEIIIQGGFEIERAVIDYEGSLKFAARVAGQRG